MWELVELREIRIFLTLCDELHFGRAAERLQLSHGRVSQVLQQLEAKLGVRLFDRTSRSVAPTPEGHRLHDHLTGPYEELRGVLRDACARGPHVSGELRLGLLFPSSGGPRLMKIVEHFEWRHPGSSVTIREVRFDDPLGPLRRDEIDVMACRLPMSQPDLLTGPVLASDERILAVAVGHALAERESVSVEDLADYCAHDAGGMLPRAYVDTLIPPRAPSGRPIRRLHLATPSPSHVLALVARREIVHPTIASFPDHFGHPGVTYIPFRDLPPMEAGLVWRKDRETDAIRAFTRAATETIGANRPESRRLWEGTDSAHQRVPSAR